MGTRCCGWRWPVAAVTTTDRERLHDVRLATEHTHRAAHATTDREIRTLLERALASLDEAMTRLRPASVPDVPAYWEDW
jgi:hypothetical protein